MTTLLLRIAAAQYDIGYFADWNDYERKVESWVERAVANGAQLLLWPEYASLELVSLFNGEVQKSLTLQLQQIQSLRDKFLQLHDALAKKHGLYILPGTFPLRLESGEYRNRAWLFGPDGLLGFQDKLQMTRFEREQWFISAGDQLRVFDTAFGTLGINICYDSEFPLLARRQAEMGAKLILVPSCTDTMAGYHRVRIGCQARALENQCYVVQSPTVGNANWSEAVDVNNGAAGVFTPVDYGFPDNGMLVQGEFNRPQWLYADLDLASVATVRNSGQVFNYRDWPGQHRIADIMEGR